MVSRIFRKSVIILILYYWKLLVKIKLMRAVASDAAVVDATGYGARPRRVLQLQ